MKREDVEKELCSWVFEDLEYNPKETLKYFFESVKLLKPYLYKNVKRDTFFPFEPDLDVCEKVCLSIGELEASLTILKKQLGIEIDKAIIDYWNSIKK